MAKLAATLEPSGRIKELSTKVGDGLKGLRRRIVGVFEASHFSIEGVIRRDRD
jgi:hypothetical protein